jgi:hypothetical protein
VEGQVARPDELGQPGGGAGRGPAGIGVGGAHGRGEGPPDLDLGGVGPDTEHLEGIHTSILVAPEPEAPPCPGRDRCRCQQNLSHS